MAENSPRITRQTRPEGPLVLLSGCWTAAHPVVYDFGPGLLAAAPTHDEPKLPALALDLVETNPALDSTAVLYRLAYADSQQLRPYGQARWSMTPAQLLRQRLRHHFSLRRALLNPGDISHPGAPSPVLLRIELEEFSQLFEAPDQSVGLLRLRATLTQPTRRKMAGATQLSGAAQRPQRGRPWRSPGHDRCHRRRAART